MASVPAVAGQSILSGFEIETPITTGEWDSFAARLTTAEPRDRAAAGSRALAFADLLAEVRVPRSGPRRFDIMLAIPADEDAFASPSRLELQTASDSYCEPFSMKGLGLRPLPAAMSAIVRPEATERSSARVPFPLPARSKASRCFMSSQL